MLRHRGNKPSDFHPVVPNITDESMRERDPDVEKVKQWNEQQKLKKEVEKSNTEAEAESAEVTVNKLNTPHSNSSNKHQKQDKNSVGRSIIIGILIVVITVLVILLIYQAYKMLTTEEDPLEQPPIKPPGLKPGPMFTNNPNSDGYDHYVGTISHKTKTKVVDDSTDNIKDIPDHVRNMDNSILAQYIQKKDKNSHNINTSRETIHQNMMQDVVPDPSKDSEDQRVSSIIDSAMNKEDRFTIDEKIPSRDDETMELRQSMIRDKQQRDELFTIAEENSYVTDGLDIDIDNDSNKSESDGCQFILTKGKNKGVVCGKSRSTHDRCPRHENK